MKVVSPIDASALLASELQAETRWAGLSLADAMCLATAVQCGASVVTADCA